LVKEKKIKLPAKNCGRCGNVCTDYEPSKNRVICKIYAKELGEKDE
jgi:hypothetical protein